MSPGSARDGAVALVRVARFAALGADVVVSTRDGGVSPAPYDTLNLGDHVGDDPANVRENRHRLAAAMGVDDASLVIATQVHGADAATVTLGDAPGEADILATTDPRIAVCVLVADCAPIVVVDPVARVLVVAHAGWRGTASDVAARALGAAVTLGATAADCHAEVGPCISAKGYQVGSDVADALERAGCGAFVEPDGTGRYLADLAAANVSQLVHAGVPSAHVTRSASSTDTDRRFYSDRGARPTGRFALAARLRDPAS